MGLETGTYISSLSADNPTAVDFKSQGDDHLRLIKSTIRNTFPNHSKPTYQAKSSAVLTDTYIAVLPTDYGKTIPINCGTANKTVTLPTPTDAIDDQAAITFMKSDASKFTVGFSGSIAQDASYVLHQTYQKCRFEWNHTLGLWVPWMEEKVPRGALQFSAVALTGYVELRGGTVGKTGTAATYANDNYLGLYQVLWDTFSNSLIPVTGGRGLTAAADFAAGKLLTLFNYDNYVLGAMSSDHAIGSKDGAETYILTADQIPELTGSGTAASGGAHSHTLNNAEDIVKDSGNNTGAGDDTFAAATATNKPELVIGGSPVVSVASGGAHTHTVSVTVNAGAADEMSLLQKTAYQRLWMKF